MSAEHDLENGGAKDFASGLERYDTNQSSMIPPMSRETFEKLYLSPKTPVAGQLRKTFGNPTPMALMGFVITATPLSCILMGWRGAGGAGASIIGVTYFFGGMLQVMGAVMEWIIANTFVAVVFATFGAFFLAFSATLTPIYNAQGAFLPGGAHEEGGIEEFYASFAFVLLWLAVLILLFAVCALRTNVLFVAVFVILDVSVGCLTASYWQNAQGNAELAEYLEVVAGGFLFVVAMLAWYLLASQLLQAVDFPLVLPVGDLSTRFPSLTRKRREATETR